MTTRDYFAAHAALDRARGTLTLPRLMQYFRRDFGDRQRALTFAAQHLDGEAGAWVLQHLRRIDIEYAPYDWTIVAAGVRA